MEPLRVGVTGARRGEELAALLARRGAQPQWGPTLEADLTVDDERIAAETDAALAGDPGWLAATTGVGMRTWLETADRTGRGDALRDWLTRTRIVARGAKALGALRAAGLNPEWVSPNETDADVAGWLAEAVDPGQAVVIQQHGDAGGAGPYDRLSNRADLRVVATYRLAPPRDPAPAHELIAEACAGGLDAVVATSAPAVRNLFALAAQAGRRDALAGAFRGPLAAAAVGSVTAVAFEEHGVPVTVMPHRSRTADLVRALEAWHERRADASGNGDRGVPVAPPVRLDPHNARVWLSGREVALSAQEFALLAALLRRPEVVCPPEVLAREVWGHRDREDAAQVRNQLGRVRRKLGDAADAIVTVRSVGYRFDPARLPGPAAGQRAHVGETGR